MILQESYESCNMFKNTVIDPVSELCADIS